METESASTTWGGARQGAGRPRRRGVRWKRRARRRPLTVCAWCGRKATDAWPVRAGYHERCRAEKARAEASALFVGRPLSFAELAAVLGTSKASAWRLFRKGLCTFFERGGTFEGLKALANLSPNVDGGLI